MSATRSRPRDAKRSPTRYVVLGAGAVVLLLAVVAVVASGGGDDGSSGSGSGEVQAVEVMGEPLPPLPGDGSADPAVGAPVPTASGSSFDGTPVSIGEGPALLAFVAHWCSHCQAEVPVVTEWLRGELAVRGVPVVAVSTSVDDNAPNHPPSAWLEREGWPAPVLVDDENGSVAMRYGVSSFPYFVAVDAEGRVAGRITGEQPVEVLEALVDAALGG